MQLQIQVISINFGRGGLTHTYLTLRTGRPYSWEPQVKSRNVPVDPASRVAAFGDVFQLAVKDPVRDLLQIELHEHTILESTFLGKVEYPLQALPMGTPQQITIPFKNGQITFSVTALGFGQQPAVVQQVTTTYQPQQQVSYVATQPPMSGGYAMQVAPGQPALYPRVGPQQPSAPMYAPVAVGAPPGQAMYYQPAPMAQPYPQQQQAVTTTTTYQVQPPTLVVAQPPPPANPRAGEISLNFNPFSGPAPKIF